MCVVRWLLIAVRDVSFFASCSLWRRVVWLLVAARCVVVVLLLLLLLLLFVVCGSLFCVWYVLFDVRYLLIAL